MKTRCTELVSQGDVQFAKRYPIMSLWQQSAEQFHVMRADFTRLRYISEEFASYLMTGRPAIAHRDFAAAIPAMMRRPDQQWFWARTHEQKVNDDREARAYLDWRSELQYRAMYEFRAHLVRSCKEVDGDYAAFGNGVITVDRNRSHDGLLIRSWHLRDVVWTEGEDLIINSIHHKRKISARDLNRLWPKKVPESVKTALKDEPNREFNCRRIVVPVDEYDLEVRNKARFPYVSIIIDIENDIVLEEVPQRSLRYVIPRWATISGSQYAYSPAVIYALPDGRMLQQITLTMLEAGQKATDPPMIAVTEAINGGVNSGAGMITWTDADYDERTGEVLRPMEMRFDGIKFGAEREERIEGMIDGAFYLNQIRFPQITKDMTAYEASKLYDEFTRNNLPLLEPLKSEYNSPLCAECSDVLDSINYFGDPRDMPEVLSGREIAWEFDTPLKAAAEQAKVFTFSTVTDIVAKAMQVDPGAVRNVDINKGLRAAVMGAGGADWLLDEKDVAAAQAQDKQQAQATQAANAVAHGADTATKVATAVQSASQAGQAVQQGGMAPA